MGFLHDRIAVESFSTHEDAVSRIERAVANSQATIRSEMIGHSEEGRPIQAVTAGNGPVRVSLIAGSHADEPVGPETLRHVVLALARNPEEFGDLLERFTLHIVPHVNPDGEVRNRAWIEAWPDLRAYVVQAVRELPGRDVEFGYPDQRIENRSVAAYWQRHAPFDMHASLHGMGFSDGAMLLIDREWADRTKELQSGFARAVTEAGLRLHDHDRGGEKGFEYIAPGFTSTPRGRAMRDYFMAQGDPTTARRFGDSSMEYIRSLGGDPLCIVTELPLFLVRGRSRPGVPEAYLAFKRDLPGIRLSLAAGGSVGDATAGHALDLLPIRSAAWMQLRAVDLALSTVERGHFGASG